MLDKIVRQQSGFFKYIEPGGVVLAGHGFAIAEVTVHGAKLEIPAFTRGKTRLSQREV